MAEETRTDSSSSSSTAPAPDSRPNPQVSVSASPVHPFISLGNTPMNNLEDNEYGPGLHAILNVPFMETMAGLPPRTLIPLRYNIPTMPSSEGAGNEHEQELIEIEQPFPEIPEHLYNAFHLKLSLIFKLAVIVLFLSQDESMNTFFLIFCASLVYLYQIGLLDHFMSWLQQVGARHLPQNDPPVDVDGQNNHQPALNAGVDNLNQNQPAENQEPPNANENGQQGEQRNNLVQVMREIRMLVVGFFISLLPEVENND